MDRLVSDPTSSQRATSGLSGGVCLNGCSLEFPPVPSATASERWIAQATQGHLFARYGDGMPICRRERVLACLRGYAVPSGADHLPEQVDVLGGLVERYLGTGALHVQGMEGSFTLTLLDARCGSILIYRNLGDCNFTYYTQVASGLYFSSSLPDLLQLIGDTPQPHLNVIPQYFLFRTVPGSDTLLTGVKRLRPGQLLTLNCSGAQITTLSTLSELRGNGNYQADCVDAIEVTIRQVVSDYASFDPSTAVLLSGGVDSSLLQIHWNAATATRTQRADSIAVITDHPVGRLEREYALTAADLLGTQHREVAATRPYAEYLVRAISATGEPPNHVQSAYFMPLADAMAANGIAFGICGQAADALFGSPWGDYIHRARWVQRLVPFAWSREALGYAAAALGKPYWSKACRLANFLDDPTQVDHPINHHDAFGDFDAVRACFGEQAIVDACTARRALLDQLQANADVLQRVNEIAFAADSYDTCALWSGLCEASGVKLWFPFMDTRVLRIAVNTAPTYRFAYRKPKWALKTALRRHLPADFVNRRKLAFSQPIYDWLGEGGQLRPLVDRMDNHGFVDRRLLSQAKLRPTAFLYCLLCYDLWHKLFLQKIPADILLQGCV